MRREPTFGESARMVGPAMTMGEAERLLPTSGGGWDAGDEEAEDDQLLGMETVLSGHQAGWTLMERLYVFNGSFYVVT